MDREIDNKLNLSPILMYTNLFLFTAVFRREKKVIDYLDVVQFTVKISWNRFLKKRIPKATCGQLDECTYFFSTHANRRPNNNME